MRRFSLYIHIPYCHSKCPYCDFNSYAATQWPEAQYTAALIAELQHYAAQPAWQGAIQTIFFGGGTPSLFAPESIAKVLEAVQRLWALNSSVEITLEANPGTVTREKLLGFRAAGVNRISFGVQSFHPHHLARLGRIHSAEEATAAIELARGAGFDNLNLDLIFAIPGQTLEEWQADLRTAVTLAPDHISAYNLTFEEGTAFHAMRVRGQLRPAAEEVEVAMFTQTQEILGASGHAQYEISNYARAGRECRHNLNYWRGGAYLGAGAGAHSFTHLPAPGTRWGNEKNPNRYMQQVSDTGHARASEESLAESQARGEFVFLGLRLRGGFDAGEFADRFGDDFISAFPHAEQLRRDGLLVPSGSRWRLTDRGLMVADSVFATFL
jgi:putative oxygen-independent coproporphyrinogen III oxidase